MMIMRVYEYRLLRGDVEFQIQEKHAKDVAITDTLGGKQEVSILKI